MSANFDFQSASAILKQKYSQQSISQLAYQQAGFAHGFQPKHEVICEHGILARICEHDLCAVLYVMES